MKKFVIQALQKRNGYFDRELVVELVETKTVMRYFVQRYYRNFLKKILKIFRKKNTKIHPLERMAEAFEPICFRSRIFASMKKRKTFTVKTIQIL